MNLQIRDPRARELAETLAKRRGTNMTEAVIDALEAELERTPSGAVPKAGKVSPERLRRIYGIIDRFTKGRKPRPDMTKDEIDAMWGHD